MTPHVKYYPCGHCKKPMLGYDLVRCRIVFPVSGVRNVNGNIVARCPHCGKDAVFGELNPLAL